MPRESAMSRVIARAVASGRRSRAVYPLRALHEAPEALRMRVDAGEEVRLIDDLPTRLMVISGPHAIAPEPLGSSDRARRRHPLPSRRRGSPSRVALTACRGTYRGRTNEYAAGSTCQLRCRSGPLTSPSALIQ